MTSQQTHRPETAREVEQKFRIHGLFQLPDLRAIDGVADMEELGLRDLESAYFDTPDLRLAREGITLRRRTGDDEGWHLKVPERRAFPGVRTEVRLPLSVGDDAPPDELTHVVRVILRDARVQHAATLRTHRSAWLLRNDAGRAVAELVDDAVHVLDTYGTTTARFRELELEERDGGPALARVADALASAGAVSGEFVAKVVRSLGPAATAPPEVGAPPEPGLDDAAGDTVTSYLAAQVRALRFADIAFRCDPDDGEPVHQMRVAARRLRSALRTFRPLLESGWASGLRDELAWFARGLGTLREKEVLHSRLIAHASEISPDSLPHGVSTDALRDLLDAELGTAIVDARENAWQILDSDRYLALHESLVAAANGPALTARAADPTRVVVPRLVNKEWKRLRADADELGESSPVEDWHAVRLRAKRSRYAADAAATALGEPARTCARQAERLTDVLGEHQDAVQAGAYLHDLARQVAKPEFGAALDALGQLELAYAGTAQSRFASIWPEARRVTEESGFVG
ncbi:CYTH and CHAD domain-containing protein [Actinobacteria bacterium YIM 96077]|uniref:CHAD domain containing protein n=1 Tax=Phytoactinopolyspora halophila TaxID=1981511 RepID=A0A329QPK8_9ACTN|nr:CYTH and CHAD domain-containing protein [Phytoactinopolyspora halophila]AYY14525.1 CYTH and CHAD domain-containing protein [Actinobacteria bacterium YIM 96077]RAW14096.1 CHAD domain containing protein [Phytoactinopolyspora halophila]